MPSPRRIHTVLYGLDHRPADRGPASDHVAVILEASFDHLPRHTAAENHPGNSRRLGRKPRVRLCFCTPSTRFLIEGDRLPCADGAGQPCGALHVNMYMQLRDRLVFFRAGAAGRCNASARRDLNCRNLRNLGCQVSNADLSRLLAKGYGRCIFRNLRKPIRRKENRESEIGVTCGIAGRTPERWALIIALPPGLATTHSR